METWRKIRAKRTRDGHYPFNPDSPIWNKLIEQEEFSKALEKRIEALEKRPAPR